MIVQYKLFNPRTPILPLPRTERVCLMVLYAVHPFLQRPKLHAKKKEKKGTMPAQPEPKPKP